MGDGTADGAPVGFGIGVIVGTGDGSEVVGFNEGYGIGVTVGFGNGMSESAKVG